MTRINHILSILLKSSTFKPETLSLKRKKEKKKKRLGYLSYMQKKKKIYMYFFDILNLGYVINFNYSHVLKIIKMVKD